MIHGMEHVLKTKSQTWRNCPMAGVVGALILFHLKNYPFAGKKAFTIKDTRIRVFAS
jgi:hypothetical protein